MNSVFIFDMYDVTAVSYSLVYSFLNFAACRASSHGHSFVSIYTPRVSPRPFTHGGDKALMGGTHVGGHRPYGGT